MYDGHPLVYARVVIRKVVLALVGVVVFLVVAATGVAYWLSSGDSVRLALEQQATAWLGEPVRIGSMETSLVPRAGIRLGTVRIGEPVRLSLGEVELLTDFRALIGRRIEDASVIIADSRIEMPLPVLPVEPDNPGGDSESAEAMRVSSIRTISLRNVQVVSRDREFVVSVESSLEGNRLTLNRLTAASEGTALEVEGEVDLAPRIAARLQVSADHLDLDELLALAQAFVPEESATAPEAEESSVSLVAQVSAETATAGGIEIEQLSAQIDMEGSRVVLSPLSFGFFGGRYEGVLDTQFDDRLAVSIESRIENVDVAALAAFGGSPDTVTGRLSAEGTFSASGSNLEGALGAARGRGEVSIVNGEVRRLALLRTVVLFFGRPAPDSLAVSDEFERIDASFSLEDLVIRADTFAMRTRDADVEGSGTLILGEEALDGALQLRLSEELSAQAGTDFARYTRDGNRVLLPATIDGTLESPRLSIDATAAAKRGLTNEVERRINRLFGR